MQQNFYFWIICICPCCPALQVCIFFWQRVTTLFTVKLCCFFVKCCWSLTVLCACTVYSLAFKSAVMLVTTDSGYSVTACHKIMQFFSVEAQKTVLYPLLKSWGISENQSFSHFIPVALLVYSSITRTLWTVFILFPLLCTFGIADFRFKLVDLAYNLAKFAIMTD